MKLFTVKLLLFLLFTIGYCFSQGKKELQLSLQDALDLAQEQSHQILIARSELDAAKGQNLESWSGFLPKVIISETFVRTNDPVQVFGIKLRQGVFTERDFNTSSLNNPEPVNNFATSFQFQQPLINIDAIYGKSSAAAAIKARKLSLKRTEEAIALEVEKAYYGFVLTRNSLKSIEKAVASAESHLMEMQSAYEEDLLNEADLLATRVHLGELEEKRLIAGNQIQNAMDGLKFLLNTRINAFGSADWHSSEIFGRDGTNWTLGAQLQWSVLDGLGRLGQVRKAKAEANTVENKFKNAYAKGELELRRARRNFRTAEKRIQVAEISVKQAGESLRIVESRFQEGLERSSELLSKEAAFTNAELRLLQARYDLKIAYSELKFYSGAENEL
jgi:outer membrane protein TolC